MERTRGLAAMAVTVVVWAGFALSIRGIGASSLTTMDAALIRFTVPVLLLAPWIPRTLRRLRAERSAVVAGLCVGAGLPYFLVASFGGSLTSAALVGLVIPGTVPVFVALLAYKIWGLKIGRPQAVALAAILAGVALAGRQPAGAGTLVLLLAGLIWAVYTLSLRVTVLDPIGTVLVLCLPSACLTAVLIMTGSVPSHLAAGAARPADVVLYLVVQGVGVGVLAALCYPIAIRCLGSRAAASLGALSPVVTAVAAVPLLGEPFTGAGAFALVVGGVVAFNLLAGGTAQHAPDPGPTQRGPALAAHRGLRP
ncbi:DMT family transporter [Actinoplanes sp. NEAU-A12]|uniref:DMT family transporter n=1 Tax=Actinoplanes sandaracinus TaxID=3045177 RepID=A0ABT6WRL7_9ACTN|nr:DMT family transporter [Actinoplanes sandaracinus]MDI6102344.1 DMT family transporter [Actinoplanes sandaracinus]